MSEGKTHLMSRNRIVVYKGSGETAVESIDYLKLELPHDVVTGVGLKKSAPHAMILKIVTSNICGSDQHMVRGRTTAPVGQTLGHEITTRRPSRSMRLRRATKFSTGGAATKYVIDPHGMVA